MLMDGIDFVISLHVGHAKYGSYDRAACVARKNKVTVENYSVSLPRLYNLLPCYPTPNFSVNAVAATRAQMSPV